MAGARDRKLEFFVVASILGVLLYLLLGTLASLQRETEEAAVQAEAGALRVELLDRLAHRAAYGGALPESDNPVRWTGREPLGYIGEADSGNAVGGAGIWFFARDEKLLVYRFHAGDEWRFRLVRSGGGVAALGGVGLLRLEAGNATDSGAR